MSKTRKGPMVLVLLVGFPVVSCLLGGGIGSSASSLLPKVIEDTAIAQLLHYASQSMFSRNEETIEDPWRKTYVRAEPRSLSLS